MVMLKILVGRKKLKVISLKLLELVSFLKESFIYKNPKNNFLNAMF